MTANKKIIIPFAFRVSAGTVGEKKELWLVDRAKVKTKEIELHFPSGALNALRAELYYGDMKVAPETGYWTGDNGTIRDYPDVIYYRGDKIILLVRNYHPTDDFILWGTLEVEEVE